MTRVCREGRDTGQQAERQAKASPGEPGSLREGSGNRLLSLLWLLGGKGDERGVGAGEELEMVGGGLGDSCWCFTRARTTLS